MKNIDWQKEPRASVECVEENGRRWMQGWETADKNRANVFGVWRDEESNQDYDYEGRYHAVDARNPVGTEVEVRFAFYDSEEIEDHAEVYVWQIYHWKLAESGAVCTQDDTFGGDYVVEAGGLCGPEAMFGPLVDAAVRRIQDARWNKTAFEPRAVGDKITSQ